MENSRKIEQVPINEKNMKFSCFSPFRNQGVHFVKNIGMNSQKNMQNSHLAMNFNNSRSSSKQKFVISPRLQRNQHT